MTPPNTVDAERLRALVRRAVCVGMDKHQDLDGRMRNPSPAALRDSIVEEVLAALAARAEPQDKAERVEVRCCPVCKNETTVCDCSPRELRDTADLAGLTTDERAKRFARLSVLDEAACCLTAEGYQFTTASKVRELRDWLSSLPAWIVVGRSTPPEGAMR